MVYDTSRRTVVLTKGQSWGDDHAVWEWRGSGWRGTVPNNGSSPTGALVYDSSVQKVVAVDDEGWQWDSSTWTNLGWGFGNSVSNSSNFDVVYDPNRERFTLLAYDAYGPPIYGFYEWDGTTLFTIDLPNGDIEKREAPSIVYDPIRQQTHLIGGGSPNSVMEPNYPNDVWSWDGTTWQQYPHSEDGPMGRSRLSTAFDAARGRVVMFGGSQGSGSFRQDIWEWDESGWRERTPAFGGPAPRYKQAMVYNPSRERMLLYGGDNVFQTFDDTWEWEAPYRAVVDFPLVQLGTALNWPDITEITVSGKVDNLSGDVRLWVNQDSAWNLKGQSEGEVTWSTTKPAIIKRMVNSFQPTMTVAFDVLNSNLGLYIDPELRAIEVRIRYDSASEAGGLPEPSCGDGVRNYSPGEPLEACDDGNTTPGDGCSATCQVE